MPSPRLALLTLCFALSTLPIWTAAEIEPGATADRKVVVVVWDGMRPDFVTERQTPTLWKLAQEGVTFRHHHSIYPTATNVNGAALATGVYPNRNTLIANREFRPAIDPRRPVEHGDAAIITKADAVSGGKYLAAPTIAEIVRAAGRKTAIAGTKSIVLLHDRHGEFTNATSKDLTRFAAVPMPAALREDTIRLLGPFPIEPGKTD
ncbi:MAG TPA: alkaline phosphatase family protein, partial [Chthoniobacterales bacterium]|nr:alkaline phosphatase family protein [Chthoniobacterales bacterium]